MDGTALHLHLLLPSLKSMTTTAFRSAGLLSVARDVTRCRACPRLVHHRSRIARERKPQFRDWDYWGRPVPGFGDPDARLLIVGLAPAAHGANRTGRMFTGDASGDWLYEALHRFGFANQRRAVSRDDGLVLKDCYISAAARCAPPGNKPTTAEFDNCQPYLAAELDILDRVSVTLVLGQLAHHRWLKASGWWNALAPADRPKFSHGAVTRLPDGARLVASYHPSRQNTNTGRLTRQMWHGVFASIRDILGAP